MCVVPDHGNVRNENVALKLSMIQKLKFHYDKLKEMADINGTKTVMEMRGQVAVNNNCNDKVYLPSWMSKQGCYWMYCQENGYDPNGNYSGNVILKQIGPDDEAPKERTVVLWMVFHEYWKKNHSKMVLSNPSKEICSLCHVFANRHKFNIPSRKRTRKQC